MRLNKEKTELRKSEITFLGHKISKDGLEVDPQKVAAVVQMMAPTNVTEV